MSSLSVRGWILCSGERIALIWWAVNRRSGSLLITLRAGDRMIGVLSLYRDSGPQPVPDSSIYPPALPPCAGRRPLRALVPLRWVFTAEASNCICCASLALPCGLALLLRLLLQLCLCRFYRLPELPLLQALVVGKHRACDFGNREHEREAAIGTCTE